MRSKYRLVGLFQATSWVCEKCWFKWLCLFVEGSIELKKKIFFLSFIFCGYSTTQPLTISCTHVILLFELGKKCMCAMCSTWNTVTAHSDPRLYDDIITVWPFLPFGQQPPFCSVCHTPHFFHWRLHHYVSERMVFSTLKSPHNTEAGMHLSPSGCPLQKKSIYVPTKHEFIHYVTYERQLPVVMH